MKKLFVFGFAAMMAVMANAQTSALSRIKETGVVKVGVRTNADPFSYMENGKANGYMVDLCNHVVQDVQSEVGRKLTVQYIPVSPSNRFELVQSGQVDLECGTTTVNPKRRELVDFSYNTFITSTHFVTLQKNKIDLPRDFYEPLTRDK